MAGIDVSLAELVRRALESRISDVWTNAVGRVETYDRTTQTASLQPVVRRALPTEDGETVLEDLPVIQNVPVLFPRGGAGGKVGIVWDLEPGDHVAILIQTVALAQWRQTGALSDPGDLRLHSLGSVLAVPALAPNADPITYAQAGKLVVEGPEILLGKNATDPVTLDSLVIARIQEVVDALATAVPTAGDGGAGLQTTFVSNLSAAGWTGTTPPSMGASKVKGE